MDHLLFLKRKEKKHSYFPRSEWNLAISKISTDSEENMPVLENDFVVKCIIYYYEGYSMR